jgi:type I restriction enzyme S subunit
MSFDGWSVENLGDIAEFQKGFAFKSKDYKDLGIKIVKVTNFSDNSIVSRSCVCICEENALDYKKYELHKKDILISTVGSWPSNPASIVGKVVRVPDDLHLSLLNQNIVRLKANRNKMTQDFLYYSLKIDEFKWHLIGGAQGSANQASITQQLIKGFKLPFPSIEEQKAIASILSALDDKIELNNKMNKTLEEMAQAIFKSWFVDFEPFQDGEFEDSELGRIPKGWRVVPLGDICKISNKSVKPYENPESMFEHFSIPSFDSFKTPTIELGKEIKSNKFSVSKDSVLVSKLNPSTKRIWRPLCQTGNAICSTEFINYRAKVVEQTDYLYSILDSDDFTRFLIANATGSTNSRQRVSPNSTLSYKVLHPNIDVIRSYVSITSPIYEKIRYSILQNEQLAGLRDTLLPKLMSGEIRVPLES